MPTSKRPRPSCTKLEKDHDTIDLEVDADTAAAEAKIDALERDRKVTIDVDIDQDRLTSTLGPTFASAGVSSATSFGSAFVSGVANSLAQANLGAVGMAALVPIAAGAGAVVASTVGALGFIPAAAASAGAAIGTLALGFQGFGDALSNMGDAEKFAAALQNLSPSAQQAALALQSIKTTATDPAGLGRWVVIFLV